MNVTLTFKTASETAELALSVAPGGSVSATKWGGDDVLVQRLQKHARPGLGDLVEDWVGWGAMTAAAEDVAMTQRHAQGAPAQEFDRVVVEGGSVGD